MQPHPKEQIIELFNLEEVSDIKWKELPVYGLNTGSRILGVIFNDNRVEILIITPEKTFIKLFRSEDNRLNDVLDFKIILEYILTAYEYKYVTDVYVKNKKK